MFDKMLSKKMQKDAATENWDLHVIVSLLRSVPALGLPGMDEEGG